ncbi:hypothetical protein GQ53DRAFT_186160 [Thozetella sp. PMI_491]|nr:hypothetical protein GQ53DRAFT_186160 [Thozetella sp. PMI_491]
MGSDPRNGLSDAMDLDNNPSNVDLPPYEAVKGSARYRTRSHTDDLHQLASSLVRQDASSFYANSCENASVCWASLLQKTEVSGISYDDPNITASLRALDRILTDQESTPLLLRFAYVQLTNVFENLESIIAAGRRSGLVHREIGYRNASIALDMYMAAQEGYFDVALRRRELLKRKRTGRRWRQLAGASPLFLLIYSDAAEAVVYVTSYKYNFWLIVEGKTLRGSATRN